MKKLMLMVSVLALVCSIGVAGEDTSGLGYIELCKPATFTNGIANIYPLTTNGIANNGVDISAYKGIAKIVVVSGPALTVNAISNSTLTIQHAIAQTGTYSAATAAVAAFTLDNSTGKVQTASVDLDALHKYVRVQSTLQGTNTDISRDVSVIMVAPRLSE